MRIPAYVIKYLLLLFSIQGFAGFSSDSTIVNPVTDVCWECLFPITVGTPAGNINITPGYEDLTKYEKSVCSCAGTPPKVGVPISFWEPAFLIEITTTPYKLHALGGVTLAKAKTSNKGTVSYDPLTTTQSSFYHVHLYKFPILGVMDLFSGFSCIESNNFEVAYLSEFDPTWHNDQLSVLFAAESLLFSSPYAIVACLPDCIGSCMKKPIDKLFWCAGCMGSLYPFSGHISHHISSMQASSLLCHRTLAKLHRTGLLKGFEEDNFCQATYMPLIKKSGYKIQMVFPVSETKGANKSCHALGESDELWGSGKAKIGKGENFIFLIWRKRQCCLDAVKPTLKAIGGF